MISAKIITDSINKISNDRITTMLITFPRIILAEFNTHRILSKNTSSSRAIPFSKMLEAVVSNPFIPMAWQKTHKGMQGTEYITDKTEVVKNITAWIHARDASIKQAEILNDNGVTKQVCNRLLEPWQWVTMIVTGTEWENFFSLRCPRYEHGITGLYAHGYKSKKDVVAKYPGVSLSDIKWLKLNKGQAEIHMMALAECMWDAYNESYPRTLDPGEWHIPFRDKISIDGIGGIMPPIQPADLTWELAVSISTVMCARTSYTVVGEDQKELSYNRMLEIDKELINADPRHASPLEHCARTMSEYEHDCYVNGEMFSQETNQGTLYDTMNSSSKGWCRNFRGFIQRRHLIESK